MSNIRVSIIIPSYGHPDYLKKAIESVMRQTYDNWELIIVDDNNPETEDRKKTEILVASFVNKDGRIKYFQHKCNQNGAAARNTGFSLAQGEYISLLDSDDEYLPDRLRLCVETMDNAPEDVAGIYTGCEFRKGGDVYHVEKEVLSGNFMVETLACRFMFCTGSNIFIRKSVVDELKGFDPTFLRHQDYEFLVRVFRKYSLIGIPRVLVVKNNENFNVPDVEKLIAIKRQYLDKYSSIIEGLKGGKKNYIFQSNYVAIAEAAMGHNKYSLAKKYYKMARQYGKLSFRVWMRMLAFPFYNMFRR